MIRVKRILFGVVTAFILLLNVCGFANDIFADTKGEVSIFLYSQQENFEKHPVVGSKLKVWKLSDEYENKEKKEIVDSLEKLSVDELDKKFENSRVTEPSGVDGKIVVSNLENGAYYVREVTDTQKEYEVEPFAFKISDSEKVYTIKPKFIRKIPKETPRGKVKLLKISNEQKTLENVGFKLISRTASGDFEVFVSGKYTFDEKGESKVLYTDKNGEIFVDNLPVGEYIFREVEPLAGYIVKSTDTMFKITSENMVQLKVVNDKTNKGEKVFVKTSNAKNPEFLEGAIFRITVKKDGNYIPVQRDGKDYEITSKKNGEFKVSDLDFGTYYLWEIKAPKGYKQLSEPIEFVIDENSKTNEITVIKNEPFKPMIPKTGDIVFISMVIGGAIVFITGYVISREKKKYR
ncbi:MAG: SpaA isopeptide-forming pilin-related protein [Peptoniphilaceae bacterium]|uniref:MSCRAMM family protein n=1 Tax=Parvimonas sp. TaxID=1944660 RepID=UPI002A74B4D0|nr:SpaA isopeptide-forming pilin-related protein [Parvimonas sp.]MDD7764429.1 SpaA isopeptide-forming pilin-related protein [Peptoniphilaceae bacterium]MDY3051361.1 SpaA isopeptide-forming pilin-related protein [Parvimonas sp.]